ncbi:uncharacterized protein K02A2.6-like [Macrosteles quadrilineatus]|uniref:uncharacterized protein K02A2.6-like n=1 Tax=Macrosteles quadrilineatus TaxID=74068 RepID=UPI0023E30386|nr:uncharacterized protein K02A2.6-like [Macrosteles quadrilineatus]
MLEPPSRTVRALKNRGSDSVNILRSTRAFVRRLSLPIIVVDYDDVPLFGLSWVLSFDLALPPGARVCTVTTESKGQKDTTAVKKLLGKYPEIFSDKLGIFAGEKVVITLAPEAIPKAFKPRPIPYVLRPAVKEEIDRLMQDGVLEKIDPTLKNISWASPIVVAIKPNGKVRICWDFKCTINPFISSVQHPLPRFEDIMMQLQDGNEFTVLDLKGAYLQLEVAESSRDLLVIATPFGYFRYTRLTFGVKSAPGLFQSLRRTCVNHTGDLLWVGDSEAP